MSQFGQGNDAKEQSSVPLDSDSHLANSIEPNSYVANSLSIHSPGVIPWGSCLGIDLGSTDSVVACLDDNGQPMTVRNSEGHEATPSAVYFDSDSTVFGQQALQAARLDATRLVRGFKQQMGDRLFPKVIAGQQLPPVVIQALFLQQLTRNIGVSRDVVIAVPDHFDEPMRKATQDAGQLAGVNVADIINESTATMIAYTEQHGYWNNQLTAWNKELVLVYDLGGGTFNVTVMEVDGENFDTISTAGDLFLGGVDWDQRLMSELARRFQRETGVDLHQKPSGEKSLFELNVDPETLWECLHQQAEYVKEKLSQQETFVAQLEYADKSLPIELTRAEFEILTEDLLERTRLICRGLLEESGLVWSDFTRIVLVGGSSQMPMVQRMLENESQLPISLFSAPEAVAQGAAIYGSATHGVTAPPRRAVYVAGVNSRELRIMGLGPSAQKRNRQVLIARNSPLPAERSQRILTVKDGQQSVAVTLVESGSGADQRETRIGDCVVNGLPPDLPIGSCVNLTFQYTRSGRLVVAATLPDVNYQANAQMDRDLELRPTEYDFWKVLLDSEFVIDEMDSRSYRIVDQGVVSGDLEKEIDELLLDLENDRRRFRRSPTQLDAKID